MFEVRIHGRGGQGVVTAAEMLSIAAFEEGHHAQAFPSFGSERTGAPVVAFCRVSDREIRLREPIMNPDALIVQDPTLLRQFPTDDTMRSQEEIATTKTILKSDDTSLKSFHAQHATISFDGKDHAVALKLKGIYNIQNATGAVALTRLIMGDTLNIKQMLASLANVTPAFGRGETVLIDGQPCEMVLVKNPSGFRLSLTSFSPSGYATMIAINDAYADGRDMSWLWDVEFESLRDEGVVAISGVRCYDMALRLQYDEVEVGHVDQDLASSLEYLFSHSAGKPKRIFCTYTAMLAIRRELAKQTNVEVIR